MLDGLRQLGFDVTAEADNAAGVCTVQVTGAGGRVPAKSASVFCGNSGTTIRFLTALCALGEGTYELDGVARMRQRPIGPLVSLLNDLGADIRHAGEEGYPPISLQADGLPGGTARFATTSSSQYLSAVVMAGPYAKKPVRIELDWPQTSWPYVKMTMWLMDRFGYLAEVEKDTDTGDPVAIVLPNEPYRATDYAVEPDASAASYFLAAAAVVPGSRITIDGLGAESLQGDVGFAHVLGRMGAQVEMQPHAITLTGPAGLSGIDVDLADMPDVAQTLAVTALFAEGPTTIRSLHTLRVKETDRLAALEAELTKLSASVEIDGDTLHIAPPKELKPAEIDTYDDHRMAMSFAVAGVRAPGMVIRDAGCVAKTYPRFFEDLRRVINGPAAE